MDEYISRKAAIEDLPAEALERNLDSVMTDDAHRYHRAAERVIAGVPAADVRLVVTCADCKHWARIKEDCILASCDLDALVRCEDFYCANGEKREGN